jgi:hypothetical protein
MLNAIPTTRRAMRHFTVALAAILLALPVGADAVVVQKAQHAGRRCCTLIEPIQWTEDG